ncbi:MAG: tetratricopeptide repeat protein [Bdellovibrionales bacterium]
MERLKIYTLFLIVSLSVACSTSLKVVSEPEKAVVYVKDNETNEKRKIGETPIDKRDDEVKEFLEDLGTSGEFVTLVFEKEGFSSKEVYVPISPSGSISTEISVKLNNGKQQEVETAQQIIDSIFLAQSYARAKEFERALIEIDKVLVGFPKFDRALSMKASIYYAKGDFKQSLEWYDKAIDANPKLTQAINMSAKIRKQLKLPAREPASLPAKKGAE